MLYLVARIGQNALSGREDRAFSIQDLKSSTFYSLRESSLMRYIQESIESFALSCNFIFRQLSGFPLAPELRNGFA